MRQRTLPVGGLLLRTAAEGIARTLGNEVGQPGRSALAYDPRAPNPGEPKKENATTGRYGASHGG